MLLSLLPKNKSLPHQLLKRMVIRTTRKTMRRKKRKKEEEKKKTKKKTIPLPRRPRPELPLLLTRMPQKRTSRLATTRKTTIDSWDLNPSIEKQQSLCNTTCHDSSMSNGSLKRTLSTNLQYRYGYGGHLKGIFSKRQQYERGGSFGWQSACSV